jgi:hypothetical protein
LPAQREQQRAPLEQLQATVARLEGQVAAAGKDSSTSSKPPSSDLVKPPPPPPPAGQDQRRRGAQPGHPKHERALFPTGAARFSLHPRGAARGVAFSPAGGLALSGGEDGTLRLGKLPD